MAAFHLSSRNKIDRRANFHFKMITRFVLSFSCSPPRGEGYGGASFARDGQRGVGVSTIFSLARQMCRFAFRKLCFCALKGMLLECERAPFELRLLSSLTMQRYNNHLNPASFYCTFYTKNCIFFVKVLLLVFYKIMQTCDLL